MTTKQSSKCVISLPTHNSLTYIMPHSHLKVHLTAGETYVYEDAVADAILNHPLTEMYEGLGWIEIKDRSDNPLDNDVFEVADSKSGDALPVGDLPSVASTAGSGKAKTKYRGKAGKSKAAAREIIDAKKKDPKASSTTDSEDL